MAPNDFYRSLSKTQRDAYASMLGLSSDYLRIHLFPRNGIPDRKPGMDTLVALCEHSDGQVSIKELIDYFCRPGEAAA